MGGRAVKYYVTYLPLLFICGAVLYYLGREIRYSIRLRRFHRMKVQLWEENRSAEWTSMEEPKR
jgi:hypothetical protein